jgi:hypothetical protein
MPNLNLPIVIDWTITVTTAPPPPPPGSQAPSFTFQINVFLQNNPNPVSLRVETLDELSAIVGVLSIPGGRLFFNQAGQTLVKSLH